jgi:arylsulfatase A-like enzyme
MDADWQAGNGSWSEKPVDFARVSCHANGTESVEWCSRPDLNESEWADFKIAATAIERLRAHAAREGPKSKPLFLGVGFRDNHLAWAAPPKWRALFDPAKVKATAHGQTPDFNLSVSEGGVPRQAWQYPVFSSPLSGTDPGSEFFPRGRLTDMKWLGPDQLQEALRSYMATIAMMDSHLAKVLNAFDEVGYTNDTVVLFAGDHGQNLGEHNTWTKMTAWEHSLRIPLIISVPWLAEAHGSQHYGMAEMVDFYRTLSDLSGVAPTKVDKGVEGDSLAAVVAGPPNSLAGKEYAFSQTQRVSVSTEAISHFWYMMAYRPQNASLSTPHNLQLLVIAGSVLTD